MVGRPRRADLPLRPAARRGARGRRRRLGGDRRRSSDAERRAPRDRARRAPALGADSSALLALAELEAGPGRGRARPRAARRARGLRSGLAMSAVADSPRPRRREVHGGGGPRHHHRDARRRAHLLQRHRPRAVRAAGRQPPPRSRPLAPDRLGAVPAADLRSWIDLLKREGELVEVEAEVDPYLEVTEIVDRVVKSGGPALLFTERQGLASARSSSTSSAPSGARASPSARRASTRRAASSRTCSRCSRRRGSSRR